MLDAVWQTYDGWGGGVTVRGMSGDTSYCFHIKARNLDGVESGFGGWNCTSTEPAPATPCDLDYSGVVDLLDHAIFADCLTGPGALEAPVGCSLLDFDNASVDGDDDCDLADFAGCALNLP